MSANPNADAGHRDAVAEITTRLEGESPGVDETPRAEFLRRLQARREYLLTYEGVPGEREAIEHSIERERAAEQRNGPGRLTRS